MTKQSDFFLKLSYKKYIYNFDQRQKSVNTRKNNSCEQGTDIPRSNCCSMIMEIFDRLANIRPHLTNM